MSKFHILVITIVFLYIKTASSLGQSLLSSARNNGKALQNNEFVDFEKIAAIKANQDALGPVYFQQQCQLVPIHHYIMYKGCQTKAIDSFACYGSCPSYTQISYKNIMELDKSCSCCQQVATRKHTFTLDCPALDPPYKKVETSIPIDCVCKSCEMAKQRLQPQELIEVLSMTSS